MQDADTRNTVGNSPPPKATGPNVYGFLDHRAYLAAYFQTKQKRGLSYRGFSRRVGLGAPNYLKQVIDGKKRLSADMALRFANACGLNHEASAYFVRLVAFNHASTMQARNEHFQALQGFRRYRAAQPLALAQAAYHSDGNLPAIRELVASRHFREDLNWIANSMRPPIKAAQVKRAIDTLLELGLLLRDEKGALIQSEDIVTTGAQANGMHIANYHAQMMQRATQAMDTVPAVERDMSALTLCIDGAQMPEFKSRLQAFRRELLELAETAQERTRVVQINLQLFPLTQTIARPEKKSS